jgi:hypothetical protein
MKVFISIIFTAFISICNAQIKSIKDMEKPSITYDFPNNKPNPFDINSEDRYFVDASGFTNLTNNLNDFNIDTLGAHIPMGYKTIIICQRICFVVDGEKVKSWEFDKKIDSISEIKGRYLLFTNKKRKAFLTDWKREIESYGVLKDTKDASIYSYLWESYEDAESYAKKLSQKESVIIVITKVVNSIGWH